MTERVGQQLGNYRLIRLLGQGGFGEVYLGEHIYLRRMAAIKVLHMRLAQEEVEDFLQEARTVAALNHPHIVRVLEFGMDASTPFLVMDYAPHGTLRQCHPKGSRVPLETIVSYVKQVAQALQYAHDRKLVHRDLKPENLFVGENHEVLLGDFGIALVTQSSHMQSTQDVVGTVAYMSPEQIQGKPRPASDQYSLGIIVYEWLCGERPFYGSTIEVGMQHALAPPPPLREKVPMILVAVEQVVMTALQKDYHQRFDSVQAFALALEQASQDDLTLPAMYGVTEGTLLAERGPSVVETDVARPVAEVLPLVTDAPHAPTNHGDRLIASTDRMTMGGQDAFPPRRRRSSWGKVALFAALLLLVVGSASLFYSTVTTSNTNMQATVVSAANAYGTAVAAQGIMKGFDTQHTGFNPYEHILSPTTVAGLRKNWTFPTGGAIVSSPAVASGVVYVGSFDRNLYALDAKTGAKLWAFSTAGPISYSSPAVANGVVYVGSLDKSLYALDARTGAKLWSFLTGSSIYSSPAVANGVVYVGSGDKNLYALDARTGAKLWAFPTGKTIGSSPAVANGVVYVGSGDKNLYALDARTGAKLWSFLTGSSIYSSSPAVANGVVYIGSDDYNLYALDARTGAKLWAFPTGKTIGSSPAVANGVVYVGSTDGKLYAFGLAA